jgi:AcrR family transcriptional regulator
VSASRKATPIEAPKAPSKSRRSGSRTPKQDRSKESYEAILDAANRVLAREGYSDASTVKIAREAGVSVGTVYAYFTDKDDIFSKYIDCHISDIFEAIAANVTLSNYGTVEDGIRDIIDTAVAFTLENKNTLSAMVAEIPGVYDGMMLRRTMKPLYAVAEQFYRTHGLVETEEQARRLTYVLSGAVSGFFMRMMTDPELPLSAEELSEELVALVMGYIVRYRDA